MLRGVLKPMPDYQSHCFGDLVITKDGLEFVVDEAASKSFEMIDGGTRVKLTPSIYEEMRQANGRLLMIEPIGGMPSMAEAIEERDRLVEENTRLRAELAQIEAAAVKPEPRKARS
jgi:hypothetical protein